MRHIKKWPVVVLAGLLFGLAVGPSRSLSCNGPMNYRFLPNAEARVAFQKLMAKKEKQLREIPALWPNAEVESWIKYYKNPIFKPGPAGSWESVSADCFTVMVHEGKYLMWYVGTPTDLHCQVGLATSPDGLNWTRHPDNPVLKLGPAGSWDSSIILCQQMIYDQAEGIFKAWYVGGTNLGVYGIGYATSPDGVYWTKYAGNPVMVKTLPWEGALLEGQCVLKTPTGYKMWYGGLDLGSDVSYLGYAESNDGIHWIKHAEPVLSPAEGTPRPWDGYSVDTPDVYYRDGVYHMYYRGWRKASGTSWIGHATSTDGIRWTRDPANPVLLTATLPGEWDNWQIYRSRIVFGPEEASKRTLERMYFTGRDYSYVSQVGVAFRAAPATTSPRVKTASAVVNQDEMVLAVDSVSAAGARFNYFTPWLSNITVTIYDAAGTQVRRLVRDAHLPGFYEATWNLRDARGRAVRPGLYYCELATNNFLITKEFVLE